MSGPTFLLLSRDVTFFTLCFSIAMKCSVEVLKFNEVALEAEERSKVTKT